jgi:hypothetical protein
MYKDSFTQYAKSKEINFEDLKVKKEKLKGLLNLNSPKFLKTKKNTEKKMFYISYKPNFIIHKNFNFNNSFSVRTLNFLNLKKDKNNYNEVKPKFLKLIENKLKDKSKFIIKKGDLKESEKKKNFKNMFLKVNVLNNFKHDPLFLSLKLQYRKKEIKKEKEKIKFTRIINKFLLNSSFKGYIRKLKKRNLKKNGLYFNNNYFLFKTFLNVSLNNSNKNVLFTYLQKFKLKQIIFLDSSFKNAVCFLSKNIIKFYFFFNNLRLIYFPYNLKLISFDKVKTLLDNKFEILDKFGNLLKC